MNKLSNKPSMKASTKERRKRVIARLEKQIKWGMRNPHRNDQTISPVPLIDKDFSRIEKELLTLKTRI